MNLDELISKYLDGELSPSEDLRLRALIKENPAAKAEFDSAVLVCMALKEDAKSINTPDYVYHSVEDAILMEIMKAAPNETRRSNPTFALGRKTSFALMFAVTIIGGAFNFSRIAFEKLPAIAIGAFADNSSKIEKINEAKTVALADNAGKAVKSVKRNNFKSAQLAFNSQTAVSESKEVINNDIITNNPDLAVVNNSIAAANNDADKSTKNTNNDKVNVTAPVAPVYSYNELPSANSLNRIPSKKENTAGSKPGVINDDVKTVFNPIIEEFISTGDVQASTFFGNDMLVLGGKVIKSKTTNSFSQAVSYSIGQKSRMGLEFGYSDVEYKDFGKLIISKNQGKIEVLNPTIDDLVLKVEVTKQAQIYWGGLFFENTIASDENFTLTARVGFGSTNDGPLGFARVYGKAKVFSGVYLTAGSDLKSYYSKFGSSTPSLNTTASLVYGLQLTF